jgi:hypothetical protein
MSRREELEKELEIVNERIENADENVPKNVLNAWKKEYDSIFFELNNLYDDDEND